MKLPEEQFGQPQRSAAPARHFSPWLIGLLVVLLGLLIAVIVWGEQLIGLFLPEPVVELPPLPPEETAAVTESDIDEIESAIGQANFFDMEAELNAIDAELSAGLAEAASSTATTTEQ